MELKHWYQIRGLSKKCDGLFVGQRLEDEIKKMGQWAERNTPPHTEWSSSSDVADTGAVFGIIDALSREQIANNLDHDNPTAVPQAAADEMSELEIKMADNEDDFMEDTPTSTCRLATLHGPIALMGS